MALKKSEKRMLVLLGIVVVVAGFYKFVIDKPKTKNVPPARKNMKPAEVKQTIKKDPALADDKEDKNVTSNIIFEQYDEWGRDPFTIVKPPPPKPKPKPPPPPKVVLKGIFWKQGRAYVLIDDYVLGEGEEEGGIKVMKIEGKNVICRKGGRQFTLQWREPS